MKEKVEEELPLNKQEKEKHDPPMLAKQA